MVIDIIDKDDLCGLFVFIVFIWGVIRLLMISKGPSWRDCSEDQSIKKKEDNQPREEA